MSSSEQKSEITVDLKDIKIIGCFPALQYEPEFVGCVSRVIASGTLHSWIFPSAALIPQSRNKAIEIAYQQNPDFTHILFIDDDMCNFTENHVLKLLWNMQNNPDIHVCSALVTMRRPPYTIVGEFEDKDPQTLLEHIKNGSILPTKISGMAFTLISREVLDRTMEDTPTGPVWFTLDRSPRNSFEEESSDYITELVKDHSKSLKDKLWDAMTFGLTAHIGSSMNGEDAAFGFKLKQLGYKMHIDCGVQISHLGTTPFDFRHAFAASFQNEAFSQAVLGQGEIHEAPTITTDPPDTEPGVPKLRLCRGSEG